MKAAAALLLGLVAACAPGGTGIGHGANPNAEIETMRTSAPIPEFAAATPLDDVALADFLLANDGAMARLSLDVAAARLGTDAADPRVHRLRLAPSAALTEIVFMDGATPPTLFSAGGAMLARGYFRVAVAATDRRATLTAVSENDILSDPLLDHRWRPL